MAHEKRPWERLNFRYRDWQSWQRRVGAAAAMVAAAATLAATAGLVSSPLPGAAQPASPTSILAVVGRQVAWLNLEAPRHRTVSKFTGASNALEVTAQPDASHTVVAAGAPFPGGGSRGADLLTLDLTSGDTAPLVARADSRESLNAPTWWPDRVTLLFQRQDLAGQPIGAPGQEVPRYPSRIERVQADGSGRSMLIDDGREPSAAPDGTRLVFARTTTRGVSLVVWSQSDGRLTSLLSEGRFADLAYPQFSPRSDQIAFVAPQSGINGSAPRRTTFLDALFGPAVAYAHGIPWDPWVINLDGSGLHRVAETGADEPSVAWSPDQTELFVYGGSGSFIVELSSGAVTPLQFVAGYGPTVWLGAAAGQLSSAEARDSIELDGQ